MPSIKYLTSHESVFQAFIFWYAIARGKVKNVLDSYRHLTTGIIYDI